MEQLRERDATTADVVSREPSPFRVRSDFITLDQMLATASLFLIGLRSTWHYGLTSGYLVAVLLAPLTVPALSAFRWSRVVVCTFAACIGYGLVVDIWSSQDHVFDESAAVQTVSLLVGILMSAMVIMWARLMMADWVIAIVVGLGGVAGNWVGLSDFGHAWKYEYAIPVTVIVLGASSAMRNRLVGLVALGGLAVITVSADARSLFTMYLGTAGLLLASYFYGRNGRRRVSLVRVSMVLALFFAVYKIVDLLIMNGVLGERARERSIQDAAASGSTLLGGRPEISAAYSMMRDNFAGYGIGILPNTHDVSTGNAALERMGLHPKLDGFSEFMWGRNQYEFHSLFGDLWALCGVAGLAATMLLAVYVAGTLASVMSGRDISVLVLFLACSIGWDLLSEPLWDAEPTLILLLGLSLPVRHYSTHVRRARHWAQKRPLRRRHT